MEQNKIEDHNDQNPEAQAVNVQRIVSRMRELEIDHEPEGWPAVQMKDISALYTAVENAVPSIDLLQKRLEDGQYLSKQPDGEWWLFEKDGEGVCGGENIRDILLHLIFIDC